MNGQVTRQAVVLSYNHLFELATALFVVSIPLVWLLRGHRERGATVPVAAD